MEPSAYIWMDGNLVPWEEATVHVLTHALHYGSGVFEGIRAYQTDTGTAVFRLTEHMERLQRSARCYGIPLAYELEELVEAAKELLRVNELEAGYIRPLVFYELGGIGLDPTACQVKTIIACWRWGTYLGDEGVQHGIRVRTSSWRRISQSSFIPTAKGTGQYLNSILAKQEAVLTGYDEGLMLSDHGEVSEGSGENIFVVRGQRIFTPPIAAGILDGITRASVITLLAEDGHLIEEKSLTRGDIYAADEAFFTGTAAEVTPVRELDDRPIGEGKPGPVTRRAQDLYSRAVTGQLAAYQGWLEYI